MPREGGASSTPRLLGSIIGVCGILDRPIKPGDDIGKKAGTTDGTALLRGREKNQQNRRWRRWLIAS
jgi:hypothetical protein